MSDLRDNPRPEPGPLEGRLQRDGATYRDLGREWVPDAADVTSRSHRQRTQTRRALAVAATFVVVLGVGGLALRSAQGAGDQELNLGGSDTTIPATAPTSTPGAPSSARPVTSVTTEPPASSTTDVLPTTLPSAPSLPPTTVAPVPTTPVRPAVTTTVVAPATSVELRADGLGIVSFGDAEERVMARLIVALGMPTADSGWRPANVGLEPRPNRAVSWGGFQVAFLENTQGRYLAAWFMSTGNGDAGLGPTPNLATPDGLRPGVRYADIAERLGVVTSIMGEGSFGFRVTTPVGPLYLWFDAPVYSATDLPAADARVSVLTAGDPMSSHEP